MSTLVDTSKRAESIKHEVQLYMQAILLLNERAAQHGEKAYTDLPRFNELFKSRVVDYQMSPVEIGVAIDRICGNTTNANSWKDTFIKYDLFLAGSNPSEIYITNQKNTVQTSIPVSAHTVQNTGITAPITTSNNGGALTVSSNNNGHGNNGHLQNNNGNNGSAIELVGPSGIEPFKSGEPHANDPVNPFVEDILYSLSRSSLSTYVWAESGSGKTTFQRALALAQFNHDPETEFRFFDLQGDRWLGLEVDSSIVIHGFVGDDQKMVNICKGMTEVWEICKERTDKKQKLSRQKLRPEKNHPFRIFFNEWNNFYGWASKFKGQKLKDFKRLLALDPSIEDVDKILMPQDVIDTMGFIMSLGRDQNVTICASGQSIIKEETGLSPAAIRNANVVGIGRISKSGDGGYNSVGSLVKDYRRITDERIRGHLKHHLDGFIARNEGVIISTQGHGAITKLPDYSKINGEISKRYKYGVQRKYNDW